MGKEASHIGLDLVITTAGRPTLDARSLRQILRRSLQLLGARNLAAEGLPDFARRRLIRLMNHPHNLIGRVDRGELHPGDIGQRVLQHCGATRCAQFIDGVEIRNDADARRFFRLGRIFSSYAKAAPTQQEGKANNPSRIRYHLVKHCPNLPALRNPESENYQVPNVGTHTSK